MDAVRLSNAARLARALPSHGVNTEKAPKKKKCVAKMQLKGKQGDRGGLNQTLELIKYKELSMVLTSHESCCWGAELELSMVLVIGLTAR